MGLGLLASHRQGRLPLGTGGRWTRPGQAARSLPGHLAASPVSSEQAGVTGRPLLRGLDLLKFIQCCLLMLLSLMLLSLPFGGARDSLSEGIAAFWDVLVTILSIFKCTNSWH